ncbi:MAG: protein kinase [Bdellovibrionales bacterium]|nr:protein kinase [Bdellovibrionales bacterium]
MGRLQQLNIAAGQTISGRYVVERTVGTGSMGIVLRCRDLRAAGRPVAMKVLFGELAQDEVGVARFRNEVIAAHEVLHRNVVQPFDYIDEDGLIAYTMEFVDGTDLAGVLAAKEEISVPTAVDWLTQMGRGIHAVHRAGIVHRDLKPENVMLSVNGELKIMDFGIARADGARKLTAHGALLGTLEYMSPEYLTDGKVHHLGDVYSLGVIGYELLTGCLPHKAANLIDLVRSKVNRVPEPPHVHRPDCPPVLSRIILRAMHPDPAQRYQSALDFCRDLETLGYENEFRVPTAEIARRFFEAQRMRDTLDVEREPDPGEPSPEAEPESEHEPETESTDWGTRVAVEVPDAKKHNERGTAPKRSKRFVLFAAVLTTLLGVLGALVFPSDTLLQIPMVQRVHDELTKWRDGAVAESVFDSVSRCDYEAVASKLPHLPQLSMTNSQGDTMLIVAVRHRCLAVANLLLDYGVDVAARTEAGESAFDVAKQLGYEDLQSLIEHHQNVRTP